MKKSVIILLIALVALLAGCASVGPLAATSNPVGTKVGEVEGVFVFGFPIDHPTDLGIAAAAAAGGITSISTVDIKMSGFFPFYLKKSTIVTGK